MLNISTLHYILLVFDCIFAIEINRLKKSICLYNNLKKTWKQQQKIKIMQH